MGEIKPIQNDHPRAWHRARFREFSAAKSSIGEPTPHMRVIMHLTKGLTVPQAMWYAGGYLTAYSVLTGEAIWERYGWTRWQDDRDGILPWLRANWSGIHTRKPRRCVRSAANFAKSLIGYGEWMDRDFPDLCRKTYASPQEEYDTWWDSATSIPYYGRYIAIRLLELMRRWGYMDAHLYDIRAVGAHSPIRCLMLLEPSAVPELSSGKADVVNRIATEVRAESAPDQSWFTFATLLCEYRACYEDGGDYAGNQHDEELEYSLSKYATYWADLGMKSNLYQARAAIDPPECLGEIQGWTKRRKDVARWMRERGVVWSDLEHDYLASIKADKIVERKHG